MPPEGGRPSSLRIALAPDAPLVLEGLRLLLGAYDLQVLPLAPRPGSGPGTGPAPVDLVGYDPLRGVPDGWAAARDRGAVLVAFAWSTDPDVVRLARSHGARGLISKELAGSDLAAAVRAVHASRPGEFLVAAESAPRAEPPPGPTVDLTPREAEILGLITAGLSNDEIAKMLFLSINSVKTYIRTGYRKIGVTRRSQAVLWGVHHGLGVDDPAGAGAAT